MKRLKLTTLTGSVLTACLSTTALHAGTIDAFNGASGFGIVYVDEGEGVVEPGIGAVTGDINNDDFVGNQFSPNGVLNCLRASKPGAGCAEGPGEGNRYKTRLTGNGALDLSFGTSDSSGITEYFNFGKTTNITDARILGFDMQLGTGTGDDFVLMDPSNPAAAVLFDNLITLTGANALAWDFLVGTEGQAPLQRVFFPDGLFGSGGQEGDIGFFSTMRAGFEFTSNADRTILTAVNLINPVHNAAFGDGVISHNMLPDGVFWDETVTDPTDESSLIAWFDHRAAGGAGGWVWGAMNAVAADLAVRLDAMAAELGVTVAELGYAEGAEIPVAVVALMEGDDLFEILPIEDLSNLNLNFNLDVGDIGGTDFTLQIVPTFAPIVMDSGSEFQFNMAAILDAANVPYLNADPGYLAAVADIMALPTQAERQLALESIGYSFLGAYSGLAYSFGSDAIYALGSSLNEAGGEDGFVTRGANSWALSDNTQAFVSLLGRNATYDRTLNNAGFTASTAGIYGGLETAFGDGFSAGVMVGAQQGDADIMAGRGTLDSDAYTIAGFMKYRFGSGGQFQGVVGYQGLSFDTTRNFSLGRTNYAANGNTDGSTIFAAAEASWMQPFGAFKFGPMASAEHYKVSVDGFTETGAGIFNLTVGDQETDVTVGRIGLRGETEFSAGSNGAVRAFGHAAYAARSGGNASVLTGFSGSNLPTALMPVDDRDDTWVDIGAGIALEIANTGTRSTNVGISYRGAFGDTYEDHTAKLFFEMRF